jgi:ubiquinol-cytochrome c reductase cytochrome c1 subunit
MRIAAFAAGALIAANLVSVSLAVPAFAAEEEQLEKLNWSFDGPFGSFDRASAQRGFLVYQQVCSACHSIKEGYYRDLRGLGLEDKQIAAVAGAVTVPTIGDDGQPADRPALPSDKFRSPYANDKAGRASNNGALPPDFSVIVKAREGGADYIHALLTGYADAPAGMKIGDGLYYNKAFPGHQIAMPPPLSDDRVTYTDGTKATLDQEARDITTFLAYMANPEMESRKRMGIRAVLFLTLLTGLTYAVKRKVWADVHH